MLCCSSCYKPILCLIALPWPLLSAGLHSADTAQVSSAQASFRYDILTAANLPPSPDERPGSDIGAEKAARSGEQCSLPQAVLWLNLAPPASVVIWTIWIFHVYGVKECVDHGHLKDKHPWSTSSKMNIFVCLTLQNTVVKIAEDICPNVL